MTAGATGTAPVSAGAVAPQGDKEPGTAGALYGTSAPHAYSPAQGECTRPKLVVPFDPVGARIPSPVGTMPRG